MAAALGTAITPAAAAPVAPRGNHRLPRHRVAASRSRAAPARRLALHASASPTATADAPDEAVAEPSVEPPETKLSKLACPICYYPLVGASDQSGTLLYLQFETAKTYLKPTIGGTIVDASCGSGLFSRLFVKSGLYSLVVALDFSENMLKQCNEYLRQESISDEYGSDH
nr:unnamed protein product [Digitaria exilis]CAB3482903.1 unnamed protein product [Digitaria exilis]